MSYPCIEQSQSKDFRSGQVGSMDLCKKKLSGEKTVIYDKLLIKLFKNIEHDFTKYIKMIRINLFTLQV